MRWVFHNVAFLANAIINSSSLSDKPDADVTSCIILQRCSTDVHARLQLNTAISGQLYQNSSYLILFSYLSVWKNTHSKTNLKVDRKGFELVRIEMCALKVNKEKVSMNNYILGALEQTLNPGLRLFWCWSPPWCVHTERIRFSCHSQISTGITNNKLSNRAAEGETSISSLRYWVLVKCSESGGRRYFFIWLEVAR